MTKFIDLDPKLLKHFKIKTISGKTHNIYEYNMVNEFYRICFNKNNFLIPLKNEKIEFLNNDYWVNPNSISKNFIEIIDTKNTFLGAQNYNNKVYTNENRYTIVTESFFEYLNNEFFSILYFLYDDKFHFLFKYYDKNSINISFLEKFKRFSNKFILLPDKPSNYNLCVIINGNIVYNNKYEVFKQSYGNNKFNYGAVFSVKG